MFGGDSGFFVVRHICNAWGLPTCAAPAHPWVEFVQFRHLFLPASATHRLLPFNRDDYRPASLFLMKS
jgi:hypothetical protein